MRLSSAGLAPRSKVCAVPAKWPIARASLWPALTLFSALISVSSRLRVQPAPPAPSALSRPVPPYPEALAHPGPVSYTGGMEVHLSPDKEARIQQCASRTGRNAEQVVEEAVDRMLESDERFVAAVEEGRAAARRGDLLEHSEVVERIEQIFRS